jgi:hypothetical protein
MKSSVVLTDSPTCLDLRSSGGLSGMPVSGHIFSGSIDERSISTCRFEEVMLDIVESYLLIIVSIFLKKAKFVILPVEML